MVTYKVINNCKGVCTYDIIAVDSDKVLDEIKDISVNKKEVAELVLLMNHEQLSLIHFRDAVEDFLVREY